MVEQADLSADLEQLKARSGLAWAELGQAFGVHESSVRYWAAGGRLQLAHQERLTQLRNLVGRLRVSGPSEIVGELRKLGDTGRPTYMAFAPRYEVPRGPDVAAMLNGE